MTSREFGTVHGINLKSLSKPETPGKAVYHLYFNDGQRIELTFPQLLNPARVRHQFQLQYEGKFDLVKARRSDVQFPSNLTTASWHEVLRTAGLIVEQSPTSVLAETKANSVVEASPSSEGGPHEK
jgi:hypothetical protein